MILSAVERHFNDIQQPCLATLYMALFSMAYFGLFRIGELMASFHSIKASDVHIGTNKRKLLFVLHTSKTHVKNMPPQMIRITASTMNRKGHGPDRRNHYISGVHLALPCPFKLLQNYIKERGGFRSENKQFFVFRDGSPVHPRHMRKCLKMTLKISGFDPKFYSPHGLRVGRGCDLHKLGISVESIKKLDHWRPNAIYQYLKN